MIVWTILIFVQYQFSDDRDEWFCEGPCVSESCLHIFVSLCFCSLRLPPRLNHSDQVALIMSGEQNHQLSTQAPRTEVGIRISSLSLSHPPPLEWRAFGKVECLEPRLHLHGAFHTTNNQNKSSVRITMPPNSSGCRVSEKTFDSA